MGILNISFCKKFNTFVFTKKYEKKRFCKTFKSLDDAIKCKNEWHKNNHSEFMVKNIIDVNLEF